MRLNSSEKREYRDVVARYVRDTKQSIYEVRDVVDWAMDRDLLTFSQDDIRAMFGEKVSEALRSSTSTDRFGRRIRLHHCVTVSGEDANGRVTQRVLWSDLNAPTDHLRDSTLQRREKIKADVIALRADVDNINALHPQPEGELPLIQMTFDFTEETEPGDLGATG